MRFGLPAALRIARLLHVLAAGFMVWLGLAAGLQVVYYVGVVAISGLLVYEHRLVKADDLSQVSTASMTMNGVVSVAFFAFTLADLLLFGASGPVLLP